MRLPDCDTGCRRTEAVSDCCLRRHKTQCDRHDKAVDEWQCVRCQLRDDTLNTSFAEYLAFSLIFLFFYRCPINSVVPPVSPLSEIGGRGHVPPPALWRRRLWVYVGPTSVFRTTIGVCKILSRAFEIWQGQKPVLSKTEHGLRLGRQ